MNGALISRSNIFELKPLSKENIKDIILKAVYDQKGMGAFNVCIDDDAVEFLSDMSEGDARSALNAVELGVLSSEPAADGRIHITLAVAEECIQRRALRYDKDGDNHYDIISAFIKACVDQIRMQLFSIWLRCFTVVRASRLLPGEL